MRALFEMQLNEAAWNGVSQVCLRKSLDSDKHNDASRVFSLHSKTRVLFVVKY